MQVKKKEKKRGTYRKKKLQKGKRRTLRDGRAPRFKRARHDHLFKSTPQKLL
jgi:hypothetical protein